MSCFKNFIIPNSSFAWWAAWLSKFDNKIIIERLSYLDRYISKLSDGFKILEIRPPTVPVQASRKPYRTIGISVFIGFIIGIFFVLIKQAYIRGKSN